MYQRILFLGGLSACLAWAQSAPYSTWRDYAGSADSAQYSSLREVTRENVAQLKVAWSYPIGDGRKYNFNPLVVDDVMYVLGKANAIVALNAVTGKEIWAWTPPSARIITTRGINYWESADRSERRLLLCIDHSLRALDARTGKPIPAFGVNGSVDLKQGLGRAPEKISLVQPT